MQHEHCKEPGRPTYSDELALTRRLIDANDREHALHHCIEALALEPNRHEWVAMLRELLSDERLVASLQDNFYVGAQAARAFHLHDRGELAEALILLMSVAHAAPYAGYLQWFEAWFDEAVRASVRIDGSAVLTLLTLGTTFGVGRIRMLPAERAAAMELVPIVRLATATIEDEPMLFIIGSAILRRAGLFEEAVAVAERARGSADSMMVATAVGLAQRGLGRLDRALQTFDGAFAKSGDVIYLHESFRVLADAGRWSEALALFEKITTLRTPEPENYLELALVSRAASLAAPPPTEPPLDSVRRRGLGHDRLIPMRDATANGARSLAAGARESASTPSAAGEQVRGQTASMMVNWHEGPSTRMCLALMLSGVADPRRANYSTTVDPVIRAIRDEVDQYSLWKLEDRVIVQALPRPPQAVIDWVQRLALLEREGYDPAMLFEPTTDFLDMWAEAKKMPPVKATARDWVAATVHAEMPVYRVPMGPDWVLRWQAAALIGLAHSEPGWSGTAKRDALLTLLRGEIDWPLAAAIRVAMEVALEDVEATHEVRRHLIELSTELIGDANSGLLETLLLALESLPYVGDEPLGRVRDDLQSRTASRTAHDDADDLEREEPNDDVAPSPPAQKRPWWKFWGS